MFVVVLLLSIALCYSFKPTQQRYFSSHLLNAKGTGRGKGFGAAPPPELEQTKSTKIQDSPQLLEPIQKSNIKPISASVSNRQEIAENLINTNLAPKDIDSIIENTDLFKTKREQRQLSLNDKIQQLREEDELLATDPSVGAVPELVANRMLGEYIIFVLSYNAYNHSLR